MKTAQSFKASGITHETTQCHIPAQNLQIQDNLTLIPTHHCCSQVMIILAHIPSLITINKKIYKL
jgi:hypothetical protein